MKQVISIENMSCQNCAKHVTEQLKALPGVSQVEVSLEDNVAQVETNQEHSLQDYQAALEDTIYKAIAVN
ncbi:heavy-metal-associated domain-containing protein [Streptococcus sp. X16XC17]|uniref:heavy-metal-associated domain-containing protein n=1 Tax=unclassified Streptococcus TaxID=2608887 RepID=UPI00066FB872|nr:MULTISPECIES: heavy metal-associated domain-containing protein [unclassified Streptococcus]TCD45503.1 heavy-metal-associated domain-containing protein [Streptococcus sp. X16XC17]